MDETYKFKIILGATSPNTYEEFQEIIKNNFNQDINNLVYDNNTIINEKNYNNYIYSIYELSYIKSKKYIDIQPNTKKIDLIEMKNKYEKNKHLLEDHNQRYKNYLEENQNLEKELEDKKQKLLNKRIDEILLINQQIGQKQKILSNFEEFKKNFIKDEKVLQEKLDEINNNFKKEFDSKILEILEGIKKKIYEEIITEFNSKFKKKLENINNIEEKLMENFEKELERINYEKIIKESENVYEIKCNLCKDPIIGQLYKCHECLNNPFYLCEICEVKNYKEKIHPHLFVKVRKRNHSINKDN